MRVFIDTNGCTLGQLQSKRVQEFLERNGETITFANGPQEADVTIFYACGLTDVSEQASLQLIGRYRSEAGPQSKVIVWGCLPKMNAASLAQVYDGPLIGPQDLAYFNGLLEERDCDCQDVWSNTLLQRHEEDRFCGLGYRSVWNDVLLKTQGLINRMFNDHKDEAPLFYLRVSEGCNRNCTYCGERLAWGRLKSRPIDEVVDEFKLGLMNGYRRFFLCSDDLGSFGMDLGYTCMDLLRALIDEDREGDCRLIIDQYNAEFLKPNMRGLFDIFASGRIELFNCQVQSGSNAVLKRMGRRYLGGEWRDAMLSINGKFPEMRLATHLMVGFPGETEQDFKETMKLLDHPLFLSACRVFTFSPKKGTAAARMKDQVPESVKKSRYLRLSRRYLYMYAVHSTFGRLMKAH